MQTMAEAEAGALLKKIARYQKYNEDRKARAAVFNVYQANLVLRIIPFLLHSNIPGLPGFIDAQNCPHGIHLFKPEAELPYELLYRHLPNSPAFSKNQPFPVPARPCIHSLKTIGSIGTIAQSALSDCDYWVSINIHELGKDGLELLREKCREIEDWSKRKGVDIHFFLMDIEQTKENNFAEASTGESAGSALKLLLKDELFRTHVLVAGKMLLWWLIPPGLSESEYQAYTSKLSKNKSLNPDEFIDLGYLSDIPRSEIFGACLWQLNKALDSPFKSVIKLAYLELLLRGENAHLPLFSDRIKCLVTFPEKINPAANELSIALSEVDPYILLARDIIAFYLLDPKSRNQALLIRECLFFKTLEGIDPQRKKERKQQERLGKSLELMRTWHLLPEDFLHFIRFHEWSYKELIAFGARVHDYLIGTYKRLCGIFNKFQEETGLTITERDIAVLGRKLFTFYKQKENKIDYVRSVSRELMWQQAITLHLSAQDGSVRYYAFQGHLDHESVKKNPQAMIKKDENLVRLVAWLLINGILSARTELRLTKSQLALDLGDIQKLTEVLSKSFPIIHFSCIDAVNLLKKETVLRAVAVVNLEKEPVRGEKNLKSTMITENNYGEYFIHEYNTLPQLKSAMRALLSQHFVSRWNKNLEIFIPPQREQAYLKNLIEGQA